jgi:hypothetical protein
MNVTRDVIQDLLPVYLADEASTDTRTLVEDFLRNDPELARSVEALRATPLPELSIPQRPTQEKEILNMTKRLLRLRGMLMGFAIFLTLFPLSFRFDNDRITWRFLQDMPPQVTVVVILGAVACWAGFFHVRRRLQGTGI